ncbi:glycosyltransferase family 2 protein [Litoribacter alkaliphilus]|uniref:Glycosyltransferase family 2 protein n=1 Tax=Litoribacter ruber TaxID=702568 RepID=A0AAP2CKG3_9BACT|nr:glycosyltransferase family 2 protein [Litoribacter alkaliphilus]MBS9525595.1 glycosyltransferase family 2 protein [Litoribacter alkaliphilus]
MVSILIPNFNKGLFLKSTLDSVLLQTYENWECIIVDDHSTDDSWEILEKFSKKDKRVRIFKRPENRKPGGNGARNYAIENAKGNYVAFLDSDDNWNPDRLRLALNYLNSHNFESIFSGAHVIRPNSIVKLPSRDIREGESVFDFIFSDDVFCPTPSLIMKKDLAQEVLFDEDLKRHQDYDFFIRAHLIKPWKYFENYDVKVNWTRPNINKINYYNCIPFYEKHWEKSKNKRTRHKYILRITSLSIRGNYKNNLASYFRNVLRKEDYKFSFKEYIMFYTPYIFFVFSRTKWFILRKSQN